MKEIWDLPPALEHRFRDPKGLVEDCDQYKMVAASKDFMIRGKA